MVEFIRAGVYNRHRIAGTVIGASSSIELDGFEQIEATPGTALLRIAARASAEVAGGRRGHAGDQRRDPATSAHVAAGAAETRAGSCGRRIPPRSRCLQKAAAFSLELADGSVVELPAPRRRTAGVPRREPPAAARAAAATAALGEAERAELREERRLRDEAERRAEARRHAINELERRLEAERDRRASSRGAGRARGIEPQRGAGQALGARGRAARRASGRGEAAGAARPRIGRDRGA